MKIELGKTGKTRFPAPLDSATAEKRRKILKTLKEDTTSAKNSSPVCVLLGLKYTTVKVDLIVLFQDYLVTEVSLNKSAKSMFPNEHFGTYEDYFRDKHDVSLLNPDQPLLYVKHLSKKVNFMKPIGAQAKRKKEKNYEDLEIHLIPELVVKQDFPAELWIQASLLPTLVSR